MLFYTFRHIYSGAFMKHTGTGRGALHWHPAFLQAIQMELEEYNDFLEYRFEYQLAADPLRIDLLIIKKPKELAIDKNIARIFRPDNILEYKSPTDYLSVRDFLKVYAYANLYAAITPGVDLADITLTFAGSRHPRKLLRYLTDERGYAVKETSPGIYHVSGDYLPIQIIESKKLSLKENLWLKNLTNDLKRDGIEAILEMESKRAREGGIDAYIDVVLRANEKILKEDKPMLRDTLTEIFEENGWDSRWLEKGREEGLEKGLEQGLEKGLEQGREQGHEEVLELLSRGYTLEAIREELARPVISSCL